MAANPSIQTLAGTLSARLKALTNPVLKKICKEEGLQQSGNKPVLQRRILDLIDEAAHGNDADALQRLRHRIFNAGEAPPSGSISSAAPTYPALAPPAPAAAFNGFHSPFTSAQHHMAARPQHLFKESAFYELRQILVDGIVLEASPNHRQNCQKTIELRNETCDRLKSDPSLRILLFSAAEQPLTGYTRLDVSFPSQIEVRVNGDEVKANYKGLKNKPGSTRPADITGFVRKTPSYKNTLLITYALTPKKFNLQVCMVKQNSVQDLARQISSKNVITKQTVVNEMLKKANDPDIVVGSSVMSLKDPVSTVRISMPIRSTICSHNQCFDAKSFLQLQEQAPTWICPICNKTISFEALAVDEYFKEILDNVPKDTDQVTVEPDGRWSNDKEKSTPKTNGYSYDASPDTDEDLVEISDYRVSAIKNEAYTPQSLTHTPPLSSREASTAPRTGSKRGSEVIDLTLSDDDEPVRPTKKVAYSTPSSLPEPPRRYQLPAFSTPSIPSRPQPQPINPISPGLRPDPPSHHPSFGTYRQPPPRSGYPGQGTSTYPTYLGSSP